jgi:opacity protein-like surface antigen
VFTRSSLKPYLGLGFGYYQSSEMTGYNEDTGEEENAKSIALNLNVGLLYEVTPSVELEVAYKYKKLFWNYSDIDLDDQLNNVYAGVNFKF